MAKFQEEVLVIKISKLYRDNEDFKKILETHKNVLELLPDIIRFHGLYKIDKITKSLENL